ncbi:protein disulfide isomerase-like 5-1 [Cryptomeria japonica]|uniref:protein disulfide isomerase-like 5-1 n=1 Tax=Cryptomeria japonica TaxID=3369 RepID=UPI0025AC607A|nr:protein disulfide isomerase-like 5-1 [Cryptomeria japonica]XP_057822453.1 protein disulfide isomerase-like 5-1 [Cryptomeria japonica]
MMNSKCFLCIFLLAIGCIYSARADVIHLNADTFTDKVKEKDTLWFVRFCVPWCKHCKKIDSLWDEFGKAVEGEDSVEIAQVDCSTSKPVCSKVDIHSYPTFKLFYNGEEYEKYTGPRDVESLKAYVEGKAEKLARGELENERALL